jgi:hypothetical protein
MRFAQLLGDDVVTILGIQSKCTHFCTKCIKFVEGGIGNSIKMYPFLYVDIFLSTPVQRFQQEKGFGGTENMR